MAARGVQAVLAEHATAVRIGEGHDDDLTGADRANLVADRLNHSDCFVPHATPPGTLSGWRSL
ncbi:hypothetical protein CEV33_3909 [Brucella grignonensis]|uniref:Uncharacterized protein n=1 Tax=Brucella grignonensis TaxID=94627 RepID=A0A256FRF6_9HYPH|nr:hypothetical protein CEV33_3909 [Brucella grignonensis]